MIAKWLAYYSSLKQWKISKFEENLYFSIFQISLVFLFYMYIWITHLNIVYFLENIFLYHITYIIFYFVLFVCEHSCPIKIDYFHEVCDSNFLQNCQVRERGIVEVRFCWIFVNLNSWFYRFLNNCDNRLLA